jgi:uncharacterized protein (TIGR02246 family)
MAIMVPRFGISCRRSEAGKKNMNIEGSPTDAQAIRDSQKAWFDATAAGDLPGLLALMTEDMVFLTPGRPPFGRDAFASNFTAGLKKVRIQASGEFEEIVIVGEVAYGRGRLSVVITPHAGGAPQRLAGYTLSVYRRQPDGRWLMARDANLLAPENR